MMFFQGSWYCTQCGHEFHSYLEDCNQCEGEHFDEVSIIQDQEVQIEMDIGVA